VKNVYGEDAETYLRDCLTESRTVDPSLVAVIDELREAMESSGLIPEEVRKARDAAKAEEAAKAVLVEAEKAAEAEKVAAEAGKVVEGTTEAEGTKEAEAETVAEGTKETEGTKATEADKVAEGTKATEAEKPYVFTAAKALTSKTEEEAVAKSSPQQPDASHKRTSSIGGDVPAADNTIPLLVGLGLVATLGVLAAFVLVRRK
jgi:hypothetical protein